MLLNKHIIKKKKTKKGVKKAKYSILLDLLYKLDLYFLIFLILNVLFLTLKVLLTLKALFLILKALFLTLNVLV